MRSINWTVLGIALVGCGQTADPAEQTTTEPPAEVEPVVLLEPAQQLVRASMAIRGTRPDPGDVLAVDADPELLSTYVDQYMETEEYLATIRDMHAELLRMRAAVVLLPPEAALEGERGIDIHRAIVEEPLQLISHIVSNDLPYTDIVTADYSMTSRLGAPLWGADFDPSGADWQVVRYGDDRPAGGILSSNGMWVRHNSNGSNYHRARANTISRALLCNDFLDNDVPITGSVDLSDDAAVAHAVENQAECVSCHQSLDPLAAHMWGFHKDLNFFLVQNAFQAGCNVGLGSVCYPIQVYQARTADDWLEKGLRAPGYFGSDSGDVGDLGAHLAGDSRFSMCTARRFYGYLTQTEADTVPLEIVAALEETLVSSGFDAKALTKAIVMSEPFLAQSGGERPEDIVGIQVVRPEQFSRSVAAATGFTWVMNADEDRCESRGRGCWGDTDILADDAWGYRTIYGGIDGNRVTQPTHTMAPAKALVHQALAAEAANFLVDTDFGSPNPRLLTISAANTEESTVRNQLVDLHLALFGEIVGSDSAEVDASYALFSAALATRDPAAAWRTTATGLLQDPSFIFY